MVDNTLKTAIEYALDGKAVLFTGSGFSYGCKNHLSAPDNEFPLGDALRDLLAKDLGITTSAGLKSVSQYYIGHRSIEQLIERLKEIFTLAEATDDQRCIMSIPWKRVYTTNYDLVAETMSDENGNLLDTITLSSEYFNPQNRKACIHLNGSITNLTPTTLMNEFKLTDSSYAAEELDGKPWFEFMKRDFASAKAVFIVGYSNSHDIDISRILARPAYHGKVIFINKPKMDEIDKSTLESIGKVYDIGLTEFSKQIKDVKATYIPSPTVYLPFESFIYENMEPSSVTYAEFDQLTDFYYKGLLSDALFYKSTAGDYKYIAYRKVVDLFINNLGNKKAFVAISTLGNGKSVFCRIVREELRKRDIDVYTYVKDGIDIEEEIAAICEDSVGSHGSKTGKPAGGKAANHKRRIVIIDDYNSHMDVISKFGEYDTEKITFLLTTRRSNLESNNIRLSRVLKLEPNNLMPLYLYKLERNEAEDLARKLRDNNILPTAFASMDDNELFQHFHIDCKDQIANIVLDLFNSSSIRDKLKEMLETLMGKDYGTAYSQLCILGLASSKMNLNLTYSEMLQLLDINYLALLGNPQKTLLGEIFNADGDRFEVSSSVIAKAMLDSIVPIDRLMEVLEIVVKKADEISPVISSLATTSSKTDRWTELIKAILSHRNFEQFLHRDRHSIRSIKHFYDSVKETSFCKQNPFYWEQFAIVLQEAKEFTAAKQCLENADTVAGRIHGFIPFQIMTIRGDLVLDETISLLNQDSITADECIEKIVQSEKYFMKYYGHPENEHIRVFSNSRKFVTIYNLVKEKFDNRGLNIYIQTVTEIVKNIDSYKIEMGDSYSTAVDDWQKEFTDSLNDAKKRLKA